MATAPRKKRCGALTRKGTPCVKWAINGRERCKYHGGKSLRGRASGTYKHGEKSKYAVPDHLVDRYANSKSDPELLRGRDDIALTSAFIDEKLAEMNSGAVAAFAIAFREIPKYNRALAKNDWTELDRSWKAIEAAILAGKTYHQQVQEVFEMMEMSRRLRDTESRTLKTTAEVVLLEEQMAILQFVTELLREFMSEETLALFSDRLWSRLGRSSGEIVVG